MALVLAPAAAVTPESDATDAISKAYDAAVGPPARSDRATAASIPSVVASARTTRAASIFFYPRHRRAHHGGRDPAEVRVDLVAPATVTWAFPRSTRVRVGDRQP